jgi:hypothetical protein
MKPSNEGKTAIDLALATTNATALHSLDIDTSGSDALNFYVSCGSHNSATEGIDTISVYESDTVTQATNMTLIAALSSGTATSTSASNVLPTAAVMALGGVIQEIQVDLRKRNKKYMGIAVQTGAVAAGMPYCTLARLTRNEQSADTAAEKDQEDLGATNISGCMQVISE